MALYNMLKCNLALKTKLKYCDPEVYLKMKKMSLFPSSVFWQFFCPPLDSYSHVKHDENVGKNIEQHCPTAVSWEPNM